MDQSSSGMRCNLFDSETVRNIRQLLLCGLARACVDSTTGDLFKGPGSVADDTRNEMVEFLVLKMEALVRDSVIDGVDNSDQLVKASTDPVGFVSDCIDEFLNMRRNLLSRVSGLLGTGGREERINNFIHEMQMSNFWSRDQRDELAEKLIENMDIKCSLHCPEIFNDPEKLGEHHSNCKFRLVECANEGCRVMLSVIHVERHDCVCPFKLLPCVQQCDQSVMRAEMESHCRTVCPMKLITCTFYDVGCEKAFAQCNLDKHNADFFQSHLLLLLHRFEKQEGFIGDLAQRVQLLEKAQSLNELSGALDVRSLTLMAKEQESKIRKMDRDLKAQEARMKKLENELRNARS